MMPLADVFRILGFILMGGCVGQAIYVNYVNWQNRKKLVPPPLLLTWHVIAITIYSIGFHLKAAVEHVTFFGEEGTWRLPIFVTLGVIGNAALYLIRKISVARGKVADVVERELSR